LSKTVLGNGSSALKDALEGENITDEREYFRQLI